MPVRPAPRPRPARRLRFRSPALQSQTFQRPRLRPHPRRSACPPHTRMLFSHRSKICLLIRLLVCRRDYLRRGHRRPSLLRRPNHHRRPKRPRSALRQTIQSARHPLPPPTLSPPSNGMLPKPAHPLPSRPRSKRPRLSRSATPPRPNTARRPRRTPRNLPRP